MEPRTHARGNWQFYFAQDSVGRSFNGATHSRAWKLAIKRYIILVKNLLQWSHALTRVETTYTPRSTTTTITLQWSHALTRVETPLKETPSQKTSLPSMEPRTHARGNNDIDLLPAISVFAPMEPHPQARGNQHGRHRPARQQVNL